MSDITNGSSDVKPGKVKSRGSKTVDRKAEDARQTALRQIFYVTDTIESWINYRRIHYATPMPGEPGYSRSEHIEALKAAIHAEKDRLFERAEEHRGRHSIETHDADCESRFSGAIEMIGQRNPAIAEAWRYDAALHQQTTKSRRNEKASGPRLVWSRD